MLIADVSVHWEKFKRDYNRKYSSVDEENQRKEIFERHFQRIQNFRQTYPLATFEIGINHLSDRSTEVTTIE